MKKYKTMRSAAEALKVKGIDICGGDYASLDADEKIEVLEVMSEAKTFKHKAGKGLSRGEDFYDRMGKYGSCDA